jgi:phage-related tail fiber protein
MADYYTLLTNAGIAYENACKAAGLPIKLSQISVGDGNGAVYNPAATATALKREVWRGPLNALFQDDKNPSWLLAEVTIPSEVGGWYVREAGLWTDTGILYAIVKYPESFKPVLATSGSGKEFYIRAIFETSNAAQVTLLIDDTIVKATRAWVVSYIADELAKLDGKQSVRVATTANIVLSGAQQIDSVAVVAGDRVLVCRQAAGKDNGIYVAANGPWVRAADAGNSLEVTPGLFVSVEAGASNGDSVWQLVTDAPITLGTTSLAFEMIVGRTGVSAGAYRIVTVDKNGRVIAGSNPTTLQDFGITNGLIVGVTSDQRPSLSAGTVGGDTGNGSGGAIEIREALMNEAGSLAFDYAPRIQFHWKSVIARALAMGATGGLYWGGQQVWTAADFAPGSKADKANPTFTGTVSVPTPALGSNNKQAANTEYVAAAVAALVDASPGALDTLAELARALGNDPNFATTITNELTKRLKPGDYGVGGNAVDFPDNNLSNSVAPSGLYRTLTGALNAPPGVTVQGSLVRQEVWNSGVVQQWFGEHITGRLWRRACNSGAWSPSWAEIVMGIEGAVVAFAMSTPPVGWVICNGAALSRTTYAALFARIGTTYGAGDGSTTFNVPDVRGKVVRAADLGSGVDPGRVFGSDQMDAFPDHGHINTLHTANGPPGGGGEFVGSGGVPGSTQVSGRVLGATPLSGGTLRVANETRMKNIALLVCIKY